LQKFFLLFILVFIVSCATGGRNERVELKKYFQLKAYDQGLKFLDESKYFKDNKEHLLFLLEKSMFLHEKSDYLGSNLLLEEAKKLVSELYTIRISKKIEKSVLNDNYDLFYGEVYERSMIYFYSSLNNLLIYQATNDRNYLFKSRADILGWDSYLNSIIEERLGKTIYKNDLLLKIYGAKIHELVGTKEDEQIALQLYKDANDVLFKNYNSYKSFNSKFSEFNSNFEKLSVIKETDVRKNYVLETDLQKTLKDFLNSNIDRLSKQKLIKNNKEFLTILFENDLIAERVADKNQFGLDGLSHEPFLNLYVANVLGLMPGYGTYNPNAAVAGIVTANVAMKLFTFSFEVPKIANFQKPKTCFLELKNALDTKNEILLKKEIPLINPMGDIAEQSIEESKTVVYTRTGARLAGKHIAAIVASFATYKALGGGKSNENFLAKNAAVIQYAAATRLIEESEKADTRYWSTLPNEFRMVDIEIEPGNYGANLNCENNELFFLGNLNITKNNKDKIIKFRKF
jgi:hypothetical protein